MRERYERDGFLVLEDLFDAAEAEALKREARRLLGVGGSEPVVDQAAVEGFRKHGVFVGLAASSPAFGEAARHPRIVAVLREVLGDSVVFLSDKAVYKDATTDFGSPWHQDWPYWKGSHKVSVWIALDAATRENGCLKVIPGSHHQGELAHTGEAADGLGFDNRLAADMLDEAEAVTLELPAGGAVVFHDLLFHASHPNSSGRDRWALISTYKDGRREDPAYSWAVAAFPVGGPVR